MSQNAHTLHLFFEDAIKLKTAQLAYQYLAADNTDEAQRWAAKLGVADLESLWDPQWFNQQVSAARTHLTLCFETGTSGELPLRALETLFAHGLQSAVLEIFYDQVGETERMHFDRCHWVSRKDFFRAHPEWRTVAEPVEEHSAVGGADAGDAPDEGEDDDRYACSRDPAKPIGVAQLRKQEAQRKKEAEEAARAFVDMARAMGKSGKSPVQGLIAVLLLRAGFKGLLQAIVFTVATILLFKGFWLWLGLGLVLAIVLPLYYMLSEYKDIHGDDDDEDGKGDDGHNNDHNNDADGSANPAPGAPATDSAAR